MIRRSATLEKILRTGVVLLALGGAVELLKPRESGYNRMEEATITIGTPEAAEYAKKTLPGAAAVYGGALLYTLLSDTRRKTYEPALARAKR